MKKIIQKLMLALALVSGTSAMAMSTKPIFIGSPKKKSPEVIKADDQNVFRIVCASVSSSKPKPTTPEELSICVIEFSDITNKYFHWGSDPLAERMYRYCKYDNTVESRKEAIGDIEALLCDARLKKITICDLSNFSTCDQTQSGRLVFSYESYNMYCDYIIKQCRQVLIRLSLEEWRDGLSRDGFRYAMQLGRKGLSYVTQKATNGLGQGYEELKKLIFRAN